MYVYSGTLLVHASLNRVLRYPNANFGAYILKIKCFTMNSSSGWFKSFDIQLTFRGIHGVQINEV